MQKNEIKMSGLVALSVKPVGRKVRNWMLARRIDSNNAIVKSMELAVKATNRAIGNIKKENINLYNQME